MNDLIRQSQRPENSRHSFYQSGTKIKPITTWSFTFSRASGSLVGFTLSSHLQGIAVHLICRCSFVLRYFVEKRYIL